MQSNKDNISNSTSTTKSGEKYTTLVVKAGERYMSTLTLRTLLLNDLKRRNIPFKGIEEYLLDQFKKDGFYSSPQELQLAKTLDNAWYHYLQLFLGWIDRNYVSYEKKKGDRKVRRDQAKKQKEAKKLVTRVATVTDKKAKSLIENPEALAVLLKAIKDAGYVITKDGQTV